MRRALVLALLIAGCGTPLPDGPPRPVAPLSTSMVTSWRPTLRWRLPTGADGARVELCADPACATILSRIDAAGTSAIVDVDLPPGPVFWRLFSRTGSIVDDRSSATWEMFVRHRSAPVSTSWGTRLDVNRDGHPDLAVGAPAEADGMPGAVFVYLGSASGIDATTAVVLESTHDHFGYAVVSAGDVNGDGYGDLAVGATFATAVYLGGPDGIATDPRGVASDTWVVASAGDVNGAGYGDLVSGDGIALGSATGLEPRASVALPSTLASVAFADVNGDGRGDAVYGEGAGVWLALGDDAGLGAATAVRVPDTVLSEPRAISAGADLNGDGFADVVVADRDHAYVYLGSAVGLPEPPVLALDTPTGGSFAVVASATDADGDGYDDVVIGTELLERGAGAAYFYRGGPSGLSSSVAAYFSGAEAGAAFGASVTSPGDVDGDGYAELVVGAPGLDGASGRVFVFIGNDSGPAMPRAALLTETDERGDYGRVLAGSSP